jgi:hypothetical protein
MDTQSPGFKSPWRIAIDGASHSIKVEPDFAETSSGIAAAQVVIAQIEANTLRACLEKLGFRRLMYEVPYRWMNGGFTSLNTIWKGLNDDEISNIFDTVLKTAGVWLTYILVRRVKLLAYYLRATRV